MWRERGKEEENNILSENLSHFRSLFFFCTFPSILVRDSLSLSLSLSVRDYLCLCLSVSLFLSVSLCLSLTVCVCVWYALNPVNMYI